MKNKAPLAGVRIVEFAGLGPGPLAATLLAELGATVVRIERKPAPSQSEDQLRHDTERRSRPGISLDLKTPAGRDLALEFISRADALIEGFRPGVMERLQLGPAECLGRNPRLVYGRMTGWGQTGPRAHTAGHDLNYISLTGALAAIGRNGQPSTPPLNLVGDYGGGALYLVMGILAALLEARQAGIGQTIDVAMVDGAASLMMKFYGLRAAGRENGPHGTNLLDSGAHFYDVYRCADDGWMAVAAIEPQFYKELLARLGLDDAEAKLQWNREQWPLMKLKFARIFATQTRRHWEGVFHGSDCCVTPVLTVEEAAHDEHLLARKTIVTIQGVSQPAPAPRFSRTPLDPPVPPQPIDCRLNEVLADWGIPSQSTLR